MTGDQSPNLVLAGFMGTGKTTAGALLAERMERPFYDTDLLVERAAGRTVPEIFESKGEAAFRELERRACGEVALQVGAVISTGGGALLSPANRAALEETGVLVLLYCERDTLLLRLRESASKGERPLLGRDFVSRVDRLLLDREALYTSIPLRVDTTHLTPAEVAEQVLRLYRFAVEVPSL